MEEKVNSAKVIEKDCVLKLNKLLNRVGNIVHESVIVSKDEKDNKIVTKWGEIPDIKVNSTKGKCHHHEILAMIDGYEPKRG